MLTLYSITTQLPRVRLGGCSCRSPLAHFYVQHAESSIRELHPFTTITHLATENEATDSTDHNIAIEFLFRRQGGPGPRSSPSELPPRTMFTRHALKRKKKRLQTLQWTAKLAALADQSLAKDSQIEAHPIVSNGISISLRLEGPYFSPADPHIYDTAICLVAGTGISGALAIASAFKYSTTSKQEAPAAMNAYPSSPSQGSDSHFRRWRRCIVMWSVKASEEIDLPVKFDSCKGLELRKFLTGEGRERVDMARELECATQKTWVYISGPKAFIHASKAACNTVQGSMKRLEGKWTGGETLDYYAASWDP